jgi:hypothetical protein
MGIDCTENCFPQEEFIFPPSPWTRHPIETESPVGRGEHERLADLPGHFWSAVQACALVILSRVPRGGDADRKRHKENHETTFLCLISPTAHHKTDGRKE